MRPLVAAPLMALAVALAFTAAATDTSQPQVAPDPPAPPPAPSPPPAPEPPPPPPPPPKTSPAPPAPPATPPIRWRDSKAVGLPYRGRLVRGVRLPAEGRHFFTWDPVLKRSPNRPWRRWGTDGLIRMTLRIIREHRAAHPNAPRVAIGDLSRPHGGDFGSRFGGLGHVSHQNGLDIDIYYARKDRLERAPRRPSQVDRRLAQDLVDRFVAAGAEYVFVGPSLNLKGPRRVVQPLVHHDNHLHVRIPRHRG